MIIIMALTVIAPPPMPATTLMLMLARLVGPPTVRQLHDLPALLEKRSKTLQSHRQWCQVVKIVAVRTA